jgi:ribonuclease P protein component
MLNTQQRLKTNKDFIQVFKTGKRHSNSGVLLSYRSNDLPLTRIGFVISKKFSPLAVKRNRQRRILQAAVRELYPQIQKGFDVVISYTNRDKVLSYKDALDILHKLFTEANLIF